MKDILTTFEIARLCDVDITTVINWIDSGKLPAYKTPGHHRRVLTQEFFSFLKKYHLPVPRGIGHTVLIVEPDAAERLSMKKAIGNRCPHVTVYEAKDAFCAGKLLAEKRPSLIVLNLALPGIEGKSVCACIRSDRRLKGARILAVTGGKRSAERRSIVRAGVDGVLASPVAREDFEKLVKKLLC